MNFLNKNILLISPEPWDHIFVSKHNYAIHLANRNNKVFFLGPPENVHKIEKTSYPNLFKVSYTGFPKGIRMYPDFLKKYFMRRTFEHLEKICSTRFDVVWSFDNSVFFDFTFLPTGVISISHIVDMNQDFQTERAASTADYCFCTAEEIRIRLLRYNKKVFKINHGFAPVANLSPMRLPGSNPIKVLYSGNLAISNIDWILLYKLVSKYADVDFIFLGPNAEVFKESPQLNQAKKEVIALHNAFFPGKVSHHELRNYEVSADILLIAYQEKFRMEQTNPHKMMGYLGSGKMIVATYTGEFVELARQRLLLMSDDNNQFIELFDEAINHLDFWNKEEMKSKRMNFALDNTYDSQIDRIERLLTENTLTTK